VRIHGHGLVQRQQRGPPGPGQPARTQVLACRRYQCQGCGAVWTVLPASAVARKHFSGAAIALALALWGLCGLGVEQVRGLVNDWKHTGAMPSRWRSLGRWAEQVAAGSLFSTLEVHVEGAARTVAARAAQVLCGHAPPAQRGQPLAWQAFVGASHVS
jgi:hypothetical protein